MCSTRKYTFGDPFWKRTQNLGAESNKLVMQHTLCHQRYQDDMPLAT